MAKRIVMTFVVNDDEAEEIEKFRNMRYLIADAFAEFAKNRGYGKYEGEKEYVERRYPMPQYKGVIDHDKKIKEVQSRNRMAELLRNNMAGFLDLKIESDDNDLELWNS